MRLYEEAEKMSFLGLEFYRFGFFVMLGLLAAAGVIGFLCWAKRCEKGTAPLALFLSLVLGAICSRAGFCLMNRELGAMMPFSSWLQISGGGWSMSGLVAGVFLAGWITARMTRQNTGMVLDILVCSLPLFMALERAGEGCVPEFDYSRELSTGFLQGSFLTFQDEYGTYLATWKLAGILMLILFPILILDIIHGKKDGDTALLFLMLFGAFSVLLESLRYDRFLSISFVGLEQVLSAVFLAIGVFICAGRVWKKAGKLPLLSVLCMFLTVGVAVGLEFALDRTTFSKVLIYVGYILIVAVPVCMGIRLRKLATSRMG